MSLSPTSMPPVRIIDLSHPLTSGMPVYPGDPHVAITPALTVAVDGVAVSRIDLGSHAGTHLDAPSHSVPGGRTVDQIPLEWLMGDALILQVTRPPRAIVPARTQIAADALTVALPPRIPRIVCVATGWDAEFGSASMPRHPVLDLDLARALWERGARVLGVDTLSPDASEGSGTHLPVHDFWLGHDGIIVENLAHLDRLPERVQISLLPLNLTGVDGSPIRAIARL